MNQHHPFPYVQSRNGSGDSDFIRNALNPTKPHPFSSLVDVPWKPPIEPLLPTMSLRKDNKAYFNRPSLDLFIHALGADPKSIRPLMSETDNSGLYFALSTEVGAGLPVKFYKNSQGGFQMHIHKLRSLLGIGEKEFRKAIYLVSPVSNIDVPTGIALFWISKSNVVFDDRPQRQAKPSSARTRTEEEYDIIICLHRHFEAYKESPSQVQIQDVTRLPTSTFRTRFESLQRQGYITKDRRTIALTPKALQWIETRGHLN